MCNSPLTTDSCPNSLFIQQRFQAYVRRIISGFINVPLKDVQHREKTYKLSLTYATLFGESVSDVSCEELLSRAEGRREPVHTACEGHL